MLLTLTPQSVSVVMVFLMRVTLCDVDCDVRHDKRVVFLRLLNVTNRHVYNDSSVLNGSPASIWFKRGGCFILNSIGVSSNRELFGKRLHYTVCGTCNFLQRRHVFPIFVPDQRTLYETAPSVK